ncbi:MAG TPA: serine hydrolase domain-containing protein [Acidimicrobiia bacterium]
MRTHYHRFAALLTAGACVLATLGTGVAQASAPTAGSLDAATRAQLSKALDATFAVDATAPATTAKSSPQATQIAQIVRQAMANESLRAVIVKVMRGNQVITEQAFGQSLTGEPATTNMYFRNGAVAFEYISTLLLEYVDEHVVSLNDTIDRWMPNLPNANKVTLLMLANQTPGYPDFETDPGWNAAFNADPFQSWTYQSRINYAFDRPVPFAPGQNWSYAHTNFMILGQILSMIGKKPLATLLEDKVLNPWASTTRSRSTPGPCPSRRCTPTARNGAGR